MKIWINGVPRVFDDGTTIEEVMDDLGYQQGSVSVAVNQTFVPRGEHDKTALTEGDELEFVAPRQGG